METLAQQAAMSPRNFSRAFAREMGMSPAKAVERLRLEVALERVENGPDPIEHIAAHLGFHDPERMRRAFLLAIGQPRRPCAALRGEIEGHRPPPSRSFKVHGRGVETDRTFTLAAALPKDRAWDKAAGHSRLREGLATPKPVVHGAKPPPLRCLGRGTFGDSPELDIGLRQAAIRLGNFPSLWVPVSRLIFADPQFMAVDAYPGHRAQGVGASHGFGARGIVKLALGQQDIGQADFAQLLTAPDFLQSACLRIKRISCALPRGERCLSLDKVGICCLLHIEPDCLQIGLNGAGLRAGPICQGGAISSPKWYREQNARALFHAALFGKDPKSK